MVLKKNFFTGVPLKPDFSGFFDQILIIKPQRTQ